MKRSLHLFCLFMLSLAFVTGHLPTSVSGFSTVAYAQEKKPGFFQRLFGSRKPRVQETRPAKKNAKKVRRKSSKPTKKKKATAALPKIDDANRIIVIGDLTAGAIEKGLITAYKRTPSVVISGRIDEDISIVGDAFYPWLDASDFAFLGERVRAVVVALGTNDREPIATGDQVALFGTPEWERAYRRRLVDVSAQLQLLDKPVIWVLPPPVIDDENTEKAAAIAALQKRAVEPLNFVTVDVHGGFLGRNGKYTSVGANITGARVQLRLADGIGFTKSGAGKLAHYVQREIDSILDEALSQNLQLEAGSGAKRNTQQVIILTRPALVPDAELAGGNGRTSAFYPDGRARDYFVSGKALNPPKGRADDFSWDG